LSVWDSEKYREGKTLKRIIDLSPNIDRDKLIEILDEFRESIEKATEQCIYLYY